MKLMTKELEKKLPPLDAFDDTPLKDRKAVIKYFTPDANWTWYVIQGERQDADFSFFGFVQGLEPEWGYFTLSELSHVRGALNLPVERDLYFNGELPREAVI